MLVRFFKQGSSKSGNTSSKSVKDYLLNERVKDGTARIIRGDEAHTSEQIDLCDYAKFTSTYTSGCLSFDDKEQLTEQQKQQLMCSFEQALLPDFDEGRYACYWVEHTDKGRLELNFVYAKIDLATGKHLDVYQQRRDVARLNYWKELQIQAYGLSDPNEPHRQRLFNDTPTIKRADGSIPIDEYKEIKATINSYIQNNIELNYIHNANDVKRFIEFVNGDLNTPTGYQVKQNKTGISVTDTTTQQKFRLQGHIYGKSFSLSENQRSQRAGTSRIANDRNDRQDAYHRTKAERLATASDRFTTLCQHRGAQLIKKYGRQPTSSRPSQSLDRSHQYLEHSGADSHNHPSSPTQEHQRDSQYNPTTGSPREPTNDHADAQRTKLNTLTESYHPRDKSTTRSPDSRNFGEPDSAHQHTDGTDNRVVPTNSGELRQGVSEHQHRRQPTPNHLQKRVAGFIATGGYSFFNSPYSLQPNNWANSTLDDCIFVHNNDGSYRSIGFGSQMGFDEEVLVGGDNLQNTLEKQDDREYKPLQLFERCRAFIGQAYQAITKRYEQGRERLANSEHYRHQLTERLTNTANAIKRVFDTLRGNTTRLADSQSLINTANNTANTADNSLRASKQRTIDAIGDSQSQLQHSQDRKRDSADKLASSRDWLQTKDTKLGDDPAQQRARDFDLTECLSQIRAGHHTLGSYSQTGAERCRMAKQSVAAIREATVRLDLCHANTKEKLTNDEKHQLAYDTPILELTPMVTYALNNKVHDNIPSMGR